MVGTALCAFAHPTAASTRHREERSDDAISRDCAHLTRKPREIASLRCASLAMTFQDWNVIS
jgi:hypothetical protein